MRRRERSITIFTTPTCPYCTHAKRYLSEHGIPYTEVDVSRDRAGLRRMLTLTGQRGVPVILVGTRAMVGWDPREFERLRAW